MLGTKRNKASKRTFRELKQPAKMMELTDMF